MQLSCERGDYPPTASPLLAHSSSDVDWDRRS